MFVSDHTFLLSSIQFSEKKDMPGGTEQLRILALSLLLVVALFRVDGNPVPGVKNHYRKGK